MDQSTVINWTAVVSFLFLLLMSIWPTGHDSELIRRIIWVDGFITLTFVVCCGWILIAMKVCVLGITCSLSQRVFVHLSMQICIMDKRTRYALSKLYVWVDVWLLNEVAIQWMICGLWPAVLQLFNNNTNKSLQYSVYVVGAAVNW